MPRISSRATDALAGIATSESANDRARVLHHSPPEIDAKRNRAALQESSAPRPARKCAASGSDAPLPGDSPLPETPRTPESAAADTTRAIGRTSGSAATDSEFAAVETASHSAGILRFRRPPERDSPANSRA